MFRIIFFAATLASINAAGQQGPQSRVDLSGVPLFWEVADSLRQDVMPSKAKWNKLFDHPAYQQIQKSGNRCVLLRKLMPLAYMPSKRVELTKLLDGKNAFEKGICTHLIKALEHRDVLENYLASTNFTKWLPAASEAALQYLPEIHDQPTVPIVYIILFENNGFGMPNIVLDLYRLYSMKEDEIVALIGHELHHAFRNPLLKVADVKNDDPYASIYHGLDGLHMEGMASMVDKKSWLKKSTGEMQKDEIEFCAAFKDTPSTFNKVDSIFSLVADKKLEPQKSGNIKSMLFWGGHANGMYMAMIIEGWKGRSYLASLTGSPFDFFLAYQQAVRQTKNGYLFSVQTERLVSEMKVLFQSDR